MPGNLKFLGKMQKTAIGESCNWANLKCRKGCQLFNRMQNALSVQLFAFDEKFTLHCRCEKFLHSLANLPFCFMNQSTATFKIYFFTIKKNIFLLIVDSLMC